MMPSPAFLDLHVDSIIQQRLFGYDVEKRHRAGLRGQPLFWHADIPRMIEAGYLGACMGVHYFPWESEKGWAEANKQIDYLDALCAGDERCLRVHSPEDWQRAREQSKLGMAPGVEGAHMLNGRLERVEQLAARGVAYLTLAHFSSNHAATSSMGRGANEIDGLTAFGREVVAACNRFGIAVDVAHLNTPSALDACAAAKAPIFCTHTGVKAIHDHARNISDKEIDAIAQTGGLIGLIFAPIFLAGKLKADTEVLLNHLEHVVERVGVDFVAIGSDYDGWLPSILSDHRDCRDINRIPDGLRKRGYGEADILKICGENAERVFRGVWALREA
ncbi:MAG: membrane dipeptidase [Bradymonadaceae bacterium]|nr:membrane dipeptidase [Lujinxingiaceae bacterium]